MQPNNMSLNTESKSTLIASLEFSDNHGSDARIKVNSSPIGTLFFTLKNSVENLLEQFFS